MSFYLSYTISPVDIWKEKYDLDEDEIVNEKMSKNEIKYPVDKAKGKANKYNKL